MPPKSRQRGPQIPAKESARAAAAREAREAAAAREAEERRAPGRRAPRPANDIPPEHRQEIQFDDDEEMDTDAPVMVEEENYVQRDDYLNNAASSDSSDDEPMDIGEYEDGGDEDDVEVVENEDLTIHPGTIDYSNLFLEDRVEIMNLGNGKNERGLLNATKQIKFGIVSPFRTVFQARENFRVEIQKGIQRLKKAFETSNFMRRKKYDMTRYFFNELDARLSMMMEETTVHDSRLRVIKMIAVMTLDLYSEGKGDDFVPFILNFIEAWSDCPDVAGRINATCFITLLFESGMQKYENKRAPLDTFCGWSNEISARLYLMLQRAVHDKDSAARIPAIKGLGKLQGIPLPSSWPSDARDHSPKELIFRSCRDVDPECRVTAITTLNVTDEETTLIRDLTYFDSDTKVRVAALSRLGRMKPSKNVKTKLEVLELAFKDHLLALRDAGRGVLKEWVKLLSDRWHKNRAGEEAAAREGRRRERDLDVEALDDNEGEGRANRMKGYYLSGQALCLLWISDMAETKEAHETVNRILRHLLDVLRSMYMINTEPVASFASEVIADLRDDLVEGCVPVITKSTISSIMDHSELTETHDLLTNRAQVFYWRTMLDVLADHSHTEADRFTAIARFLSPMRTMVDQMERILIAIKNGETTQYGDQYTQDIEKHYILEMSLVENTIATLRHCQVEQAGQLAYKQLLISMIMNPFYQKKIYNSLAQELALFFKDDPEALFSLFTAKMADIDRRFRGEQFPVLEGSVLIGEAKIRNEWRKIIEENPKKTLKTVGREHIEFYQVMVLNAFLKTGILKEFGEEYNQRYTPMFRKQFQSNSVDARVVGVECMFIVGTFNMSWVEDEVRNSFGRVLKEEEEVSIAMLQGLTELYITNEKGMFKVSNQLTKNLDYHHLLTGIIMGQQEKSINFVFHAVQAMARILLNRTPGESKAECEKWESSVTTMMFRASWSIRDLNTSRIRSIIVVFLKFFCSMNIRNQEMLIKGYGRFFQLWDQHSPKLLQEGDTSADLVARFKRSAATYVALTRHSNLPPALQARHRPAHLKLVNDILEMIGQDAVKADEYSYALPYIDWKVFSKEEQNAFYLNMSDHLDVLEDDRGARVTELKRAYRRLAKLLGYDDDEQQNQNGDEMPSQASTSSRPSTSRPGPSRGKRNTSNRTNEARGGKRTKEKRLEPVVEEEPEEIRDDDEDSDDDRLQEMDDIPSTSSRGVPKIRNRCPRGVEELLNEKPPPLRATTSSSYSSRRNPRPPPPEDPMDLLNSPTRVKKGPSRPTTGSRRAPTPNRSTPLRTSSRRLNKD
ncbi:unnamed protein product [Caenorhabditis brenneri]